MSLPSGFGKLKKRPMDDMTPEERVEAVDLLRLLSAIEDVEQDDDEEPR